MGEFVSVTVTDRVATIRLDRPLFAAGVDVKEMASEDYPTMALARQPLHAAFRAIAKIPKPVVSAVTGFALGGGMELALRADFRVCGERTQFGQPEILLGIIPGAGGTQRLPRLIGLARAKNLVYTGRFVDAREALQTGLVDQVVPDAEVYDAATRLAGQFRAEPAQALRAAKQAIDAGVDLDLDAGLEIERLHFSALFGTEDQKLGMNSFIENGPGKARFVGR